jgi:hypothetical protein
MIRERNSLLSCLNKRIRKFGDREGSKSSLVHCWQRVCGGILNTDRCHLVEFSLDVYGIGNTPQT